MAQKMSKPNLITVLQFFHLIGLMSHQAMLSVRSSVPSGLVYN